jgi:hypothetical protein
MAADRSYLRWDRQSSDITGSRRPTPRMPEGGSDGHVDALASVTMVAVES